MPKTFRTPKTFGTAKTFGIPKTFGTAKTFGIPKTFGTPKTFGMTGILFHVYMEFPMGNGEREAHTPTINSCTHLGWCLHAILPF